MNPEVNEQLEPEEVEDELRDPGALEERLRWLIGKREIGYDEGKEIEKALELAKAAHGTQTRDEGDPYIVHPLRVAIDLLEKEKGRGTEDVLTALLHDVIEDTDTTYEDIERRFGTTVANQVRDLSHRNDLPRDEQFKEYRERLETLSPDVLRIKLLDRLDNLRYLHLSPKAGKRESYIRETEKFILPLAEQVDEDLYNALREELERLRKEA